MFVDTLKSFVPAKRPSSRLQSLSRQALRAAVWACAVASLAASPGPVHGVVVDQTGLAVPGATVELRDGARTVASTVTGADGAFTLASPDGRGQVVVSLPGFRTVTVPPARAGRIVLALAALSETETVRAAPAEAAAPTATTVGRTLTAKTLERLPSARQHVNDVLPMLPSVVRGPDGLLHIDGARPHEAALLVDGFDVTDPATGISAIDLPFEAVRRVGVLRDPAAVTFGGALGPLVTVGTRTGGDRLELGTQGFVPRLHYGRVGFGRVDGFFPRVSLGGHGLGGRAHYFVAAEYDNERIRVPGVTVSATSPDRRETSGTVFGRVDLQLSDRHRLTAESIVFPGERSHYGLSPLRVASASPTLSDTDAFVGVADRHVLGPASLLTVRVGVLSHAAAADPASLQPSGLTPLGWSGAWFSTFDRRASRLGASVAWERSVGAGTPGTHDVTVEAAYADARLRGAVTERTVDVTDAAGALVRRIRFGAPGALAASAGRASLAVRDSWRVSGRLRLDGGVRVDWTSLGGGAVPSARLGARYALGGATTVSGTVGEFVGTIPLLVPAFAGYPVRVDTRFDPASGAALPPAVLAPSVGGLALPRARVLDLRVERHLAAGWDVLVAGSLRRASRLATLDIRPGALVVASAGASRFHELEMAARHTWGDGNEAFVSYTRSSARGNLNDFSSLFALGDVEVLRPDSTGRLPADAPNRWLGWATFMLPRGFILAPAAEWHSGFPVLDARRVAGVRGRAGRLIVPGVLLAGRRRVQDGGLPRAPREGRHPGLQRDPSLQPA